MFVKVEAYKYIEEENITFITIDKHRITVEGKVQLLDKLPQQIHGVYMNPDTEKLCIIINKLSSELKKNTENYIKIHKYLNRAISSRADDIYLTVSQDLHPIIASLAENTLSTGNIAEALQRAMEPLKRPVASLERARRVAPVTPENPPQATTSGGRGLPEQAHRVAENQPPGNKTVSLRNDNLKDETNQDSKITILERTLNALLEEVRTLRFERSDSEYRQTTPVIERKRESNLSDALADVARVRGNKHYLDTHVGSSTLSATLTPERVNILKAKWNMHRHEGQSRQGLNDDLFKEMKNIPISDLLHFKASFPYPMKAEFLRSITQDDSGTLQDDGFRRMFISDASGISPDNKHPDKSHSNDHIVAGTAGFVQSPFGEQDLTPDEQTDIPTEYDDTPHDMQNVIRGIEDDDNDINDERS